MFIMTIMVLLHKQMNLDHISDPNTFLGVIISLEKSLREVLLRYVEFQQIIMLLIAQEKHDRHARFIGIRYIDEWA